MTAGLIARSDVHITVCPMRRNGEVRTPAVKIDRLHIARAIRTRVPPNRNILFITGTLVVRFVPLTRRPLDPDRIADIQFLRHDRIGKVSLVHFHDIDLALIVLHGEPVCKVTCAALSVGDAFRIRNAGRLTRRTV